MKHKKDSLAVPSRAKKFLIAAISAIIAVALVLTCALCFTQQAKRVGVNDEVNGGAQPSRTLSANLSGDQTAFGALLNGDIIDFTYSGGVRSITLPKGTYTLEVWGAQGGGGYQNGVFSAGVGLGGYMKGNITFSATTTVYICIGGKGADGLLGKYGNPTSSAAGGYNGGGNSGCEMNNDANDEGGGGGGATHMATTNRGTLNNYASYTGELLIVAGGGGGTSFNRAAGLGLGGGSSGTNGNTGATGGTQNAYGAAGTSGETGGNGNPGTFGKGGAGGHGTSGGGGGGGGYRGGGGAGVGGVGGGGAGYFKSGMTATAQKNGEQSGNGKARITVVSVNQKPTAKNNTTQTIASGLTLGTAYNTTTGKKVYASDFAQTASGTALAFTNGTASNLDSFTTTANTGLFLDAACTKVANSYMDWTWSGSSYFTVTKIYKYPRKGVDGCTSNGRLTLYARVRDTFVSDSTNAVKQRGWAVIPFYLTVNKNTIAEKTASITSPSAVFLGKSNTATAPAKDASASTIYNPNGQNIYTVIAKSPLRINQSFTINASDLITSNYNGTYAQVVVSLTNTSAFVNSNANRKFKVNQLDAGSKVTAYTSAKAAIANAFTQLTFTCINPDSTWQVVPATVYVVEKTSAYGSGYPNCVADVAAININIVFKVDNTRPVLNSASNIYNLKVGETKALSLASYFSDADGAISTSSHKITNVIVPSHEFMQLDRYGDVVTVASPNTSYYNIGTKTGTTSKDGMSDRATGFNSAIAFNATKGGTDTSNEAFMRYTYSGVTLNVVGLRSSFSQYTSARASGAPGHFYLLINIQDLREPSDTGIWLPIAFTVGKDTSYTPVAAITSPNSGTCTDNLTGQSASAAYPTAAGDEGDSFYFAPMAINYNGSHVVGKYKAEDADGNNTGALTDEGLKPLAIDGDSFSTSNGLAAGRGAKLNEFLTITSACTPESIVKSVSSAGYSFANGVAENVYFKAQYIPIYIEKTYFAADPYLNGRVVVNATSNVAGMGFNYLTLTADGNYYVFNGIKITLKSATMNRYFYANVLIADSSGKPVSGGVNIAIRVTNSAPTVITDADKVATYQSADNASAGSSYEYDPDNGVTTPTFTYKIPLGSRFIVTPYDFVYDPDMVTVHGEQAMLLAKGFTLNGLSGRYNASTGTLSTSAAASSDNTAFDGLFDKSVYSAEYLTRFAERLAVEDNTVGKVSRTASGTASSSAIDVNQTVRFDKLYFTRTSDTSDPYTYNPTGTDFIVNKSNTDSYISCEYGKSVQIGSVTFGMDFLIFTADTRTTRPAIIELAVRDRYGDASTDSGTVIPVRIMIEVVNTSPRVKDVNRYAELAVSPINSDGQIQISEALFSANGNKGADGLMIDPDDDSPEFITSRGTFLANTPDLAKAYSHITSFTEIPAQFSTDNGVASGRPLSDYVSASLISRFELSAKAVSSTKAIESGVYVYFFVSDGNGGSALGFVRIEVVNSEPVRNASPENGFDGKDPLWAIETTSLADIARNRYIVGSTAAAEKLKAQRGATDGDIKLISNDYDGLHNATVLSPVTVVKNAVDGKDVTSYVNLDVPEDKTQAISRATFENAVPSVAVALNFSSSTAPAAVTVFTAQKTETGYNHIAALPESQFYVGFLFMLNGKWVDRDTLLNELNGKRIDQVSDWFDENGRWIATDWALHLQAARGFNDRLGITLSVRDQASVGGDTAGKDTAFASDRNGNATVVGRLETTVYHTVMSTGIRTKDEYSAYNGYYVVEHALNNVNTAYVPTYDGDKTSVYGSGDDVTNITYNTVSGKNVLVTDGSGTETIKTRATGSADNTLAGTNSGAVYSATADYENSGAYRYPSVIEIPSDTTKNVYVPMSYFGLIEDLIGIKPNTVGSVLYLEDYVGYDMRKCAVKTYSRNNIDAYKNLVFNISDGTTSWGFDGESIDKNPYIDISAFDDYSADGSTSSASKFTDKYSAPYYNNRLSVPTVNGNNELIGYEQDSANVDNFVGNGTLMYLENQATQLQEHNFGLVFKKKDVRTGVRDLTLTIKLARSKGNKNAEDNDDDDYRTVSVNIHIENAKLDLYADDGTGTETGLKYDGTTYYYDVEMPSATSRSFALLRRNANGNIEAASDEFKNADKIAYTDADYHDGDYRDRAYFLTDSFARLSQWTSGEAGYTRAMALNDDQTKFVNTAASKSAQSSLANYFGVDVSNLADVENITSAFCPNDGIYGSNSYPNGSDGYSSYFNVSLSDEGRVLNIMSGRQTFINAVALPAIVGGALTQENVAEAYAKRGLVAVYDNASVDPAEPSRIYYPFRALIYDNCGAGWMDSACVAVELRITVTNADPSLKTVGDEVIENGKVVGREYSMNLAVGNSVTINLYDLVTDPNMYVEGENGYYMLATEKTFKENAKGIDLETGDYLDSPFKYDEYLNGKSYIADNYAMDKDGKYFRDGGGLSLMSDKTKDVTMWMETPRGTVLGNDVKPSTNNISFTVHRRSTQTVEENGVEKSVAVNRYKFTLKFYDSFERSTLKFTFIINVTNQAPVITATKRNFTMRAGDDLTVLTSYYDAFIGGVAGGSAAYNNSATKAYLDERTNPSSGVYLGDGQNNATGDEYWKFKDINSSLKDEIVYDSTSEVKPNIHLGYLALASDDTPWSLRITDIKYDNNPATSKIWVDARDFQLKHESGDDLSTHPISFVIRAQSACVNEPVTITLTDGENGVVSCTLYITIVSSPPVALDYSDATDREQIKKAGLEPESGANGYLDGVYRIFTVPSGAGTFAVEGFTDLKTAKREFTINMQNVAKDPDGTSETANMKLYRDGSFTVNGVALVRDDSRVYHADYFDISVASDERSFTLTATGFNPDSDRGYEELTFRIADYGNGDYANTLLITLRVYTLYSDMTNPTVSAMSEGAYTSYLKGSQVVNVKSYDGYYSTANAERSKYAYLKLDGNTGNDGNTSSPIVDPDVSKTDKQTYTARLYAFIDRNESGEWKKLSDTSLRSMFKLDAATKTFRLNTDNNRDYSDYFIGGISYNGNDLLTSSGAATRIAEIGKYVDFEFTADGSAVMFTPKASTLDNENILLYVEVEKYLGSRSYTRKDAVLSAGSLFKLKVEDSAPNAVTDPDLAESEIKDVNWLASGAKGDSITFKIHDPENPFGALFTDSDAGDIVTVKPITDDGYKTVLAEAIKDDPSLDWAASEGKPRAFTIDVNQEQGTLTITVNRRIDKLVNGRYASSVSFPIVLEGVDRMNKKARTVIRLTVQNREASARPEVSKFDEDTGVGYTFLRDTEGNYSIDARVRFSQPLDIDIYDFMIDEDITSMTADTDSYVFAGVSESTAIQIYPYKYLTNELQQVYWYDTSSGQPSDDPDKKREIATVEPLGKDNWHRTGLRIVATDTTRTLSARTFLRIADRSTDTVTSDEVGGVFITLNITVMNDAPTVKKDMETTSVVMMGSDKATPSGILCYIGDYVEDKNESDVVGDIPSASSDTYLRVFSQQPLKLGSLYSKMYDAVADQGVDAVATVDSSALFTVTIPQQLPADLLRARKDAGLTPEDKDDKNDFNQWFVITPIMGYYGSGSVEITVADGDINAHPDTLTTTFRINVQVVYSPDEMEDTLNPVTVACCKTVTLDTDSLMPELENKLDIDLGGARAGENDTFSQAEYYALTYVDFQNGADGDYAEIKRVGSTSTWTVTAGRQVTFDPIRVNVRYSLISDPTKVYSKHFFLNIIANKAPKLIYGEITFVRYNRTDDILRDLNDANSIKLQAYQLFSDEDDPQGTALRFISVKSKVPSLVKVSLSEDKRYLNITFAARGESEITVEVTDETGTPVSLTFVAKNTDLPEGSLWLRMRVSFESNKLVWVIVICAVALLLIILIIIIAVLSKRKREREELEALLVSEMEIEEQMLKLAGGPSPTDYQSFGYLQSAPMEQTPDLMLGAGMNDPSQAVGELAPPPQDINDGMPPVDGDNNM